MNRTPRILIVLLSLIGIGIGLYLTWIHLQVGKNPDFESICNINATFNCDVVNSSEYSTYWGIPLALFGVAFYLVTTVLGLLSLKEGEANARAPELVWFFAFLACILSVGLAYISSVRLGAWCLFCVGLYVVNAGMFAAAWWACEAPFKTMVARLDKELASFYRSKLLYLSAGCFLGVTWLGSLIYDAQKEDALAAVEAQGASEDKAVEQAVGAALQQDELAEAREDWRNAKVVDIPLHGSEPVKGGFDAPVVLVEFADFECPFCSRAAASLEEVTKNLGDQVKLIYKHYPLDMKCNPEMQAPLHEHACDAALASICAQKQGRFWEMYNLLFANQSSYSEKAVQEWATALGMDLMTFNQCRSDPATRQLLDKDVATAIGLGIQGTPSLFINGRKVKSGTIVRPELLEPLLQEIIQESRP